MGWIVDFCPCPVCGIHGIQKSSKLYWWSWNLKYKINRFWSWELCVLFGMRALSRNALCRLLLMHFQPQFSHILMITWVRGKLFPILHQFLLCLLNMCKFCWQGFGSGFQFDRMFQALNIVRIFKHHGEFSTQRPYQSYFVQFSGYLMLNWRRWWTSGLKGGGKSICHCCNIVAQVVFDLWLVALLQR